MYTKDKNNLIPAIPSRYKENVCYLVNNSDNLLRKQRGKYPNDTADWEV